MEITDEDLKKMNKEDLKQLKARISFVLKYKGTSDVKDTVILKDHLFYDAVITELNKTLPEGTKYSDSFFLMQKSKYLEKFLDCQKYLDEVLKEITKKSINNHMRMKFYKMSVNWVIKKIQETSPEELSIVYILNYIKYIPAIIERNFPGYYQAGLLDLVFDWDNKKKI